MLFLYERETFKKSIVNCTISSDTLDTLLDDRKIKYELTQVELLLEILMNNFELSL